MNSAEAANLIIHKLKQHGHEALLAGGCVRDTILGLNPKDYDVATSAPPQEVCRIFRRTKKVGAQFGVVIVKIKNVEVEVATFRTDGVYEDGRRPSSIQFTSAREDALRRDFTINGMFFDPTTNQVVDYVNGQNDLAGGILRCIGDPQKRFSEDHLRMLRAVRFAARFDFQIASDTLQAMIANAPYISDISPERIRMELEHILTGSGRLKGWRLIASTNLKNHLVKSIAWSDQQVEKVAGVLGEMPTAISIPLAFACILHPFELLVINEACIALRCSNNVLKDVKFLVDSLEKISCDVSLQLADLKLLLASGLFDDLATLARAVGSSTGKDTSRINELKNRADSIKPELVSPAPFVNGDDLMRMGAKPGPILGSILETVYRMQLNEELPERETALHLAASLLKKS